MIWLLLYFTWGASCFRYSDTLGHYTIPNMEATFQHFTRPQGGFFRHLMGPGLTEQKGSHPLYVPPWL